MARRLAQLAVASATLALACSVEAPPPLNDGAGGNANASSSSQSSSAMSSSAVTTVAASSAMSSSTGMMMEDLCDPPAEPGSIYENVDQPLDLSRDPIPMCDFRGEVLLVVNTAAA